jgi:hypothetical protein
VNRGEEPHASSATRALEHVHGENPAQQVGPCQRARSMR